MDSNTKSFIHKAWAWIADAWAMAGVLIAILLAGEGVSFIAVRAIGLDDIPMGYRTQAEGFIGKVDPAEYMLELLRASDVRWEPFSYWRGAPFSGKHVYIRDNGIRQTVNNKRAFEEKGPVVFIFGGSPTWGFGARDGYTIPSQVSAHLAGEHGIRAVVINYGQIGHVSAQSLIELENELRAGRAPAAAVFLDGSNEIISQIIHGKPGKTPHEANRAREFNLLNESRARALWAETALSLVNHSSVYRLVKHYKDAGVKGESAEVMDKDWDGMARAYRFNISAAQALADRYKFKALFYWQPFVFGKKSLTKYEKYAAESSAYLKPAVEQAQASLSRINFKAERLAFTDLSGMFAQSEEPVYLDWCHFSEIGNRALAQVIARDIAKALGGK